VDFTLSVASMHDVSPKPSIEPHVPHEEKKGVNPMYQMCYTACTAWSALCYCVRNQLRSIAIFKISFTGFLCLKSGRSN
jgi:hypothetical protein